jgi:hypothetical protein
MFMSAKAISKFEEMFKVSPSEVPGLKFLSISRSNGHLVATYDGSKINVGQHADDDRWVTVDETIGVLATHPSLSEARYAASFPETWAVLGQIPGGSDETVETVEEAPLAA